MNIWIDSLKPQTLPAFHYFCHWEDFSGIENDDLEDEAGALGMTWADCQKILVWWESASGAQAKDVIFSSAEDYFKYYLESPTLNLGEIEFLEEFIDSFTNLNNSRQTYFIIAVYKGVTEDGERDFESFTEIFEGDCGFLNDENYLVIGKPLLRKWLDETDFNHLWSEIYEIAKDELHRIHSRVMD